LDPRHPDAGFRYAVTPEQTLVAEFTPTTQFCPQSGVLTKASHRAWNGLADAHEFERVEVRLARMHQNSAAINEELAALSE
jgi:metal-sulfur cluster biosynthetic enzyme